MNKTLTLHNQNNYLNSIELIRNCVPLNFYSLPKDGYSLWPFFSQMFINLYYKYNVSDYCHESDPWLEVSISIDNAFNSLWEKDANVHTIFYVKTVNYWALTAAVSNLYFDMDDYINDYPNSLPIYLKNIEHIIYPNGIPSEHYTDYSVSVTVKYVDISETIKEVPPRLWRGGVDPIDPLLAKFNKVIIL